MTADKLLVVTAGEPTGIGPDICLALARAALPCRVVVIADADVMRTRATMIGADVSVTEIGSDDTADARARDGELLVIDMPFPERPHCGQPNPANARALLDGLELAVTGCRDSRFAGLVTAPVQKSVINDAGIAFTGHTEFLAQCTGSELPVMLLVAGDLRVALASTHMPLRAVPDYLTQTGIRNVLQVLYDDLQSKFGIADPEIVVCGLNPHAGESGHLGVEDATIIAPAIAAFAERGRKVRGPVPADTAFTPAAGYKDAVLAMYHDQGLPVLKYAGFGHAVNVTLGLPIIRTSVDHGTALDVAGTGQADSGSLIEAVRVAAEIARQ